MTPRDTLERIAALIALASSPELNEARNSAHKACAMMREHGLVLAIEDGDSNTLITRPLRAAVPDRPGRRGASHEHKTVIVYRCSHCGRRVERPGVPCAACVLLRTPQGVWTVDCQGCGRSTPPGKSEAHVNEIALQMGFIVTDDDDVTLCPKCAKQRRTG